MSDRCRSCKAPIRWAITSRGRRIPLDAEPTPGGDFRLDVNPGHSTPRAVHLSGEWEPAPDEPLYVAHFATCPYAEEHRQR